MSSLIMIMSPLKGGSPPKNDRLWGGGGPGEKMRPGWGGHGNS